MAKRLSVISIVSGCTAFAASLWAGQPAHALTFNLGGSGTISNTTSLTYQDTTSAVNLEFLNPSGANSPVLQKNVNGVCSYMTFNDQLQTPAVFCGQNETDAPLDSGTGAGIQPANQTLTSIAFRFDRDMILKNFTVSAISFQEPGLFVEPGDREGQAGNGTVTFTPQFSNGDSGTFTSPNIVINTVPNPTGGDPNAYANFLNNSPQAPCVATSGSPAGSRCTISFADNYFVRSGTLVTITTPSFTALSNTFPASNPLANPNGNWRLFALEADVDTRVPGPLPLLGAGAAFSWSRRLRRRTSVHTKTIKTI